MFKKNKAVTEEKLSPDKLVLNSNSRFEASEAYKAARTNIMFSMAGEKECKKIIITSPTPGEGKTTTCINLAISFAQTGARVLVIDADLRKPRVHKFLGIEHIQGLSNVIGGFDKLESSIKKVEEYRVDVITSGIIPPNPAELLLSPVVKAIIDDVSKYYDYVFIDTPPVNVVSDAMLFANLTMGVIMVVKSGYTTHDMLSKSLRAMEFAGIKVLGFILNNANISHSSRRYKYGKYGYKKYGYYYGGYGYEYKTHEQIINKKKEKEQEQKSEEEPMN